MEKITGESYDIYYGIVKPSDPLKISWVFVDSFDTRDEAVKVAKRNHLLGLNHIRIIFAHTTLEWTSE